MFYHRRCGACGSDVSVFTTQVEEYDVLCQSCRMDLTPSEHVPDDDSAPDL